jgi:hypothetical protein
MEAPMKKLAFAVLALMLAGCYSDLGDLEAGEMRAIELSTAALDPEAECEGSWICNVDGEGGWRRAGCYSTRDACLDACGLGDHLGAFETLCGYDESY